mmetsp:Transcript_29498/g.75742  ORF Transcript_29498/g.75742 Transcript_29498/m.75742 type:complete len:629 (+) Transcript_29498:459-2345(+)
MALLVSQSATRLRSGAASPAAKMVKAVRVRPVCASRSPLWPCDVGGSDIHDYSHPAGGASLPAWQTAGLREGTRQRVCLVPEGGSTWGSHAGAPPSAEAPRGLNISPGHHAPAEELHLVALVQRGLRTLALGTLMCFSSLHTLAGVAWAQAVPAAPSHPWWIGLLEKYHPYAMYTLAAISVTVAVFLAVKVLGYMRRMLPGSGKRKHRSPDVVTSGFTSVNKALEKLYFEEILPIEKQIGFGTFYSPYLTAGDFRSKPSVLLLGQYSTGKTTFLKHLLQRDYPGISIGPEPTTDRFIIVGHGEQDARIPGNTVAISSTKPYQGLLSFGQGFLSRFEEVSCNHELLEGITFIDTPGVLSGEKQRLDRAYDFIEVCSWFASKSDMIVLFFDPFKLDISDEFRQVIESLQDHHDKIRVVLNKADQVSAQELMRVYGALMWSLAKVLRSPEVCKVYTGSFPDETHSDPEESQAEGEEEEVLAAASLGQLFFEREESELLDELRSVPAWTRDRKISDFAKRVRSLKTHIVLMSHLRGKLPPFNINARGAQSRLLANLEREFDEIKLNKYKLREYNIAPSDFPDPKQFRDACSSGEADILAFASLSSRDVTGYMDALDDVLKRELPCVSQIREL